MKHKIFSLLTLLVVCVTGAWADVTYHTVTPNMTGTNYETYHLYNKASGNANSVITGYTSSTISWSTGFSSWVQASGIQGLNSNNYSMPNNVSGWHATSNSGINVRQHTITFHVTNCVEVAFISKSGGNNRTCSLSVKEAGSETEIGTVATNGNTIAEVVYGTTLSASKNYDIILSSSDASNNSTLYQIRFKAPSTFKVSFDAGDHGTYTGGSISQSSVGAKIILPALTTLETGYNFNGWFTASSEGNLVGAAGAPYTPAADITLYAQYSARTYGVTLNTNDGTINSGDVTSYTFGEGATLPTDVTKDGFDFAGWFDNSSFDGFPVEEIAADATGDKAYWAKWNTAAPKYDITFAKGDYSTYAGSFPSDENVSNVILAELSSDNNYRFDGWKANVAVKEGTIDGETISAGTQIVAGTKVFVTAATTFTAQWTPKFAVSFNSVGGSAVETQYVVSGGVAEEPANPTRLNYTFTGWQLNGAAFSFSSAITGSITLEATWSRNSISGATTPVTIINGTSVSTGGTLSVVHYYETSSANSHFKYAGGMKGTGSRVTKFTIPSGSSGIVTSATTHTASRTFVIIGSSAVSGDYTTANTATFNVSDPYFSVTGDVTESSASVNKTMPAGDYFCGSTGSGLEISKLVVTVTTTPLTVTLKVEGEEDQVINVTSGETLGNIFESGSLPDSEDLGEGFLGWKNEDDDTEVTASTVISSSMVIYAAFDAAPRTVTFDAGENGTCGTAYLTEASAEAGVELPSVSAKSGYVFNGWFTAASDGTKAGDAGDTYKPSRNITLYAQYSKLYTVTYSAGTGSGTIPTETDKIEGAVFTIASQGSMVAPSNSFFSGWNDGTSNYAAGESYTMPGKNVTLTAIWTQYAQSIDLELEAATREAASQTKTYTYLSNNGYEYSGFTKTAYENHEGTIDCYKGLKLKDEGAKITLYVPAGKVVRIWLGFVSALPSLTVNGTAQRVNVVTDNEGYYHQELQFITTEHSKIVLTTASSGTVTLQDILISETYTRPVAAGQYGTICLPYGVAANQFSGVDFFGIEGTTVVDENIAGIVLTETKTSLAAGTPYIFYAVTEGTLSATISGVAATVQSAEGLVGNLNPASASVANGKFIIYEDQLRMVNGATVTCPQYRAYIDLSDVEAVTPAPGRRIMMIENGENNATAIDDIQSAEEVVKFIENGQLLLKKNGIVYDAVGRVVR